MTTEILVTGAPGNVGSEVVQQLQAQGIPFRVGAFNPQRAQDAFGEGAEIVHFDFLDPKTFLETFASIKRMFLVRPPALANVQEEIAPALDAAVAAGVQQIVFLSLQGVENNRVVPHYKIEQYIQTLDVAHTFLRASFFMQNLSTTHRAEIRDEGKIMVPVGKAKTSFIDVRDIAAVAVQTLTTPGHENQAYTLTGSEALDYYTVAETLSEVLGHQVEYTNPSIPRFFLRKLREGSKLGYALVVTGLYTITRFGNAAETSSDVAQLLGRSPISFRQFAQDYRQVWMSSSASS